MEGAPGHASRCSEKEATLFPQTQRFNPGVLREAFGQARLCDD